MKKPRAPVVPAPVVPAPVVPGPLWQIPLAVVLSLAALVLVSHLLVDCDSTDMNCAPVAGVPMAGAPPPDQPGPADLPLGQDQTYQPVPARPVMTFARMPLPLGMDDKAGKTYVLPPGSRMLDMATHRAAIQLDEINLIAVIQRDGLRHALIRLPDGSFVQVRQGDRLEDGIVAAISDTALFVMGEDMTPRAFVLGG